MELSYILYGLLVIVIIYLYIEHNKLKNRVLVEGMAGALSDEAIQNIASIYNNNGTVTIPNLRVTGDAIFDNGATMMESANNTCLRLQTKANNPNYPDGFARIEFLNKDGGRVAWANSHAHAIDHSNKAYNFWTGSLNAPGLTATGDVTTVTGGLNVNNDVVLNKNARIGAQLTVNGNSNLNGENINLPNKCRIETKGNRMAFFIGDKPTDEVAAIYHNPGVDWGMIARRYITY